VSPTLDDQVLYGRLTEKADLGRFKASFGSTNASRNEYLVETVDDDSSTDDDTSASDSDEEEDLDELYDRATQGTIDLDEIMVSAAHAGNPKGVDPSHLSKIWKIDLKTAERTLEVVSRAASGPTTPSYPETTVRMIGCFDTSGSMSISSWIHSLPPRRLANCHEDTLVANYSSQTRVSYTSSR
jgi:hypothetical protein